MPLRRSLDGGRTWTEPEVAGDVIGREQWLTCTSEGVLFISSHLLARDARNEDGVIHSHLHRSTDGGRTWERTKLLLTGEARCGEPEEKWTHTCRNVVEEPGRDPALRREPGRLVRGLDVALHGRRRHLGPNPTCSDPRLRPAALRQLRRLLRRGLHLSDPRGRPHPLDPLRPPEPDVPDGGRTHGPGGQRRHRPGP